jgi:hypothetical protein
MADIDPEANKIELERQKIIAERLKSEIDFALRMADSRWRSFESRRAYEWRINFALWTGSAAITALLLRGGAPVSPLIVGWTVVTACIVFLVYWLGWSVPAWSRGAIDFDEAERHFARANELLRTGLSAARVETLPKTNWWSNVWLVWCDWSRLSQFVITLTFLAGVVLAVWNAGYPQQLPACL